MDRLQIGSGTGAGTPARQSKVLEVHDMDAVIYRPLARGVNKTIDNTPQAIARECLAEASNNPEQAIALARRRAPGPRLRAVVAAIGDMLLCGPTN